ncbi:hypothetical protein [Hymenobacter cheonanensis]|uniref:hypothetical protein n=1 Tax=Hymenobacter sp. CA2-7 TaxID=3063993 RepID=UPI0027137539|nr:hypothetical protein [Hymenobacter sp. CA2-7]MDO7886828.1 hypothetical protein [Hymenobacter sp. CA2-7]
MAKMNMAAVASKVGGMAGGLAVAGALQRYLNSSGNTALATTWGPLGMIVGGAYLPSLVGKGNQMIAHAGDAIMVKGVNAFLTSKFPNFIAGAEDELSGPYDDSVSGYPTSDEVIVSGPYDNSDNVSGIGGYTN